MRPSGCAGIEHASAGRHAPAPSGPEAQQAAGRPPKREPPQKAKEDARPKPRPKAKNWDGKTSAQRKREIAEERKRASSKAYGDLLKFLDELNRMSLVLETYKPEDLRLAEIEYDDVALYKVSTVLDFLITHGEWYNRMLMAVQGYLGDNKVREKIRKLRETTGRTPEEAETALRLADKLERNMEATIADRYDSSS